MKYRKSMNDVKQALAADESGKTTLVTSESAGVKLKRALRRLEKVKSR